MIDLVGVTDDPMTAIVDFAVTYGRPGGAEFTQSYMQKIMIPADITKPFMTGAITDPDEQVSITP
jgi:hypothetical protein